MLHLPHMYAGQHTRTHPSNPVPSTLAQVTWTDIENAPVVTFLWVHTFPLGFYAPAVLPLLIVFCITSIETIGDVTATAEASKLKATGMEHMRRIKGGLLNDSEWVHHWLYMQVVLCECGVANVTAAAEAAKLNATGLAHGVH